MRSKIQQVIKRANRGGENYERYLDMAGAFEMVKSRPRKEGKNCFIKVKKTKNLKKRLPQETIASWRDILFGIVINLNFIKPQRGKDEFCPSILCVIL